MMAVSRNQNNPLRIMRYGLVVAVVWSVSLVGVFTVVRDHFRGAILQSAHIQAIAASNRDLAFLHWASEFDNGCRIIPGDAQSGLKNHFFGLESLPSNNKPDPEEMAALRAFQMGRNEVTTLVDIAGEEYFRLIRPLSIKQRCLVCHGEQGLRIGDPCGGISVWVPMEPFWILDRDHLIVVGACWLALILAGNGGVAFGVYFARRRHRLHGERMAELGEHCRQMKVRGDDLLQQSKFLDDIVNSLTHPFLVLDANDQSVLLANSAARAGLHGSEALTRCAFDKLLGTPCEPLDQCGLLDQVKITRRPVTMEHILKDEDGSTRFLEVHGFPILGDNDEVTRVIEYGLDVTVCRKAVEELEQHRQQLGKLVQERTVELEDRVSEVKILNSAMVCLSEDYQEANENLELLSRQLLDTNKELEAFSYSVSHDLRAPLRAINGFARILVEDHWDNLDEDGQHQLDVIQASARGMGQLIDDLLAFSRMGRKSLKKRQFEMASLVEEVMAELQHNDPGLAVQSRISALPLAYGDFAMIRQVLINLLSNAFKYSKPGEGVFVEVGGRLDETESVYWVKDRGVGFDMKYLDKIFGVFQRLHGGREFEGTGIGLALVQRIIHRHGGRVWAEGKTGQGAEFSFSLPQMKE